MPDEDWKECPWDLGVPNDLGPYDPCPVCGMLGTLEASEGEDLCVTTARIREREMAISVTVALPDAKKTL